MGLECRDPDARWTVWKCYFLICGEAGRSIVWVLRVHHFDPESYLDSGTFLTSPRETIHELVSGNEVGPQGYSDDE